MQTTKTRSASSEGPQRTSPATPRSNRLPKAAGSEPDSASPTCRLAKTLTDRSPKVIERRSPRTPVREKKLPSRVSELECQLVQLQEDLKKAKEQLSSSESSKKRAKQESEEAKNQLFVVSAKLEDSQHQLVELSAAEEARLQELCKISQERDRVWQSELESLQKQHSVDSAALASSMNEIQRLKLQLEMVLKSEAAQARQSEVEISELQALKKDMEEAISIIGSLKVQLRESEKAEADAKATVIETKQQLEIARTTIENLLSDGSKFMDSFSLVASELEESRARVNSLEEVVRKLHEGQSLAGNQSLAHHNGDCYDSQKIRCNSLESEMEQLRSALEAAEMKYQEEQIQRILQTQHAYELMEQMKIDSRVRETELKSALNNSKTEIIVLKASLYDKEAELRSLSAMNKKLHEELEKGGTNQMESELGLELKQSIASIRELKAELMDKETTLQSISEENEQLKSEMRRREMESHKAYQAAVAEVEMARAAEKEAMTRLGFVTEEADKSSRRAARVTEQLDAAKAMRSEMEAELRRLRVQADQWRKAAEAAMAVLTAGNNERLVERTGSLDYEYHSVDKKLMSSPFSDDLDDESQRKKNNNVLRRISGLWKKGQKLS
ncbi:interactor of constitutive active ROPs 2, chloroplastic-like isoform X2 [Phoenix dactylifera]|uniref:Interactor of constitutive active ROPs 2, chloroplastic-like isoform X2 n=1 Tax=Phoenix dactylifera TaxID=42345 RepID=A0A8B9AX33_PHODC|nr:interactor of constitutive active ROPs 2, chloroplastic-like isoform X2 [Phoenix dactylifera]XP_038988363.1 interactor of constitutive active ROPs 2, chloroplastic-like isoform X2 [Phoenix dactylifera]